MAVSPITYDHNGRLTEEEWMSGSTAIYTALYVYNAAGDFTSASDNSSAYAYAYNADDEVTSVDNSGTARGCEKIEPGGQCVRKPVLGFSHTSHARICVTLFVVRHCGMQRSVGEQSN